MVNVMVVADPVLQDPEVLAHQLPVAVSHRLGSVLGRVHVRLSEGNLRETFAITM